MCKIKMISPSLMCASIANFRETLDTFDKEEIELLHVDVMDGEFVPNLQLGTAFIEQVREMSGIPLDIHLMINRPEDKLDWFGIRPGEWVSVHYEATSHVQRALARIKDRGAKAVLALNPATPLCVLEDVLDNLDGVLIMTVNPGFAGQALIPAALGKIERLRNMLDERGKSGVLIEVDGNVSFENGTRMSEAGANVFVAGSSSVFRKDMTLSEGIKKLRKSL